jgi:hypothetical protein
VREGASRCGATGAHRCLLGEQQILTEFASCLLIFGLDFLAFLHSRLHIDRAFRVSGRVEGSGSGSTLLSCEATVYFYFWHACRHRWSIRKRWDKDGRFVAIEGGGRLEREKEEEDRKGQEFNHRIFLMLDLPQLLQARHVWHRAARACQSEATPYPNLI